jgi:prepilin-type N-terminal cleavage/methylation domain-containing protein/prepilin-type processing-associated H-X9-DG protein
MAHDRPRKGMTLVEMLVVIGILVVLLSLLTPAVQKVRFAAARVRCGSNLRQLAIAVHMYAGNHKELPNGCGYPFPPSGGHKSPGVGMSWLTAILPYVEQEEIGTMAWNALRQDPRGHSAAHVEVQARRVGIFLCSSNATSFGGPDSNGVTFGVTDYLGVAGTNVYARDGIFHPGLSVKFGDITDGTSNTIMIGERPSGPRGAFSAWYAGWGYTVWPLSQILPGVSEGIPSQGNGCKASSSALRPGRIGNGCDLDHFWSLHGQGANFAFADASVHFLPFSADRLLPYLATRSDGEPVYWID